MFKTKPILLTGAAGFIGFHVAQRLLDGQCRVVGIDNLNHYYDQKLKEARRDILLRNPMFEFHRMELCDETALKSLFEKYEFEFVVHLAAQAGVRYSLSNPQTYIDSNIVGFINILETCRVHAVSHLLYASSSSVYGLNLKFPFSENDSVDHPASLYAATKKSNELMAHTYSHLFNIPTTGLRFFTVYGPWGRPDMALFKFTRAIFEGKPINIYNFGKMKRDFTYIDDVVEGVVRLIPLPPKPNDGDKMDSPATARAPYRVFNIGNNRPEELMRLVTTLEETIGKKAIKNFLPIQPGDVLETFADIDRLAATVRFVPQTGLDKGIRFFVNWYREFYGL